MGVCKLGYEHACGLGQASRSLLEIRVDSQAVCPKLALTSTEPLSLEREAVKETHQTSCIPKQSNQEANISREWGRRQRTLEK